MEGKKKNILLGVLIIGIISMTVAFAALSTNLRINGTTNVAATRWNIRFENWEKVSIPTVMGYVQKSYGLVATQHTNNAVSPEVSALNMQDNSNITKVSGINVSLNSPGDKAKYRFQIVNRGTIDASLTNFTKTKTGDNDGKIICRVICNDSVSDGEPTGNDITEGSILAANGGTAYCYLELEYIGVVNNTTAGQNQTYHTDPVNATFDVNWIWGQAN